MNSVGCTILPFVVPAPAGETPVEAAWREYHSLVQSRIENPELAANLDHCMACIRAHQKWADLFLAEDAA